MSNFNNILCIPGLGVEVLEVFWKTFQERSFNLTAASAPASAAIAATTANAVVPKQWQQKQERKQQSG